jgi:hypothetical protein
MAETHEHLEPVETRVRSALGVPTGRAKLIRETAVGLPETVRCWEEHGGQIEEVELATTTLAKTTFYGFGR